MACSVVCQRDRDKFLIKEVPWKPNAPLDPGHQEWIYKTCHIKIKSKGLRRLDVWIEIIYNSSRKVTQLRGIGGWIRNNFDKLPKLHTIIFLSNWQSTEFYKVGQKTNPYAISRWLVKWIKLLDCIYVCWLHFKKKSTWNYKQLLVWIIYACWLFVTYSTWWAHARSVEHTMQSDQRSC